MRVRQSANPNETMLFLGGPYDGMMYVGWTSSYYVVVGEVLSFLFYRVFPNSLRHRGGTDEGKFSDSQNEARDKMYRDPYFTYLAPEKLGWPEDLGYYKVDGFLVKRSASA